jgi:hypothetical protein
MCTSASEDTRSVKAVNAQAGCSPRMCYRPSGGAQFEYLKTRMRNKSRQLDPESQHS